MNKYYAAIEIAQDKVKDYADIHKNCWPELLEAMKDCGMENLTIHMYKNIAFLEYECGDLDAFYEKYGQQEVTKKWNAIVIPWLEEAPTLDGSGSVATLEKVFDSKYQLENGPLV